MCLFSSHTQEIVHKGTNKRAKYKRKDIFFLYLGESTPDVSQKL